LVCSGFLVDSIASGLEVIDISRSGFSLLDEVDFTVGDKVLVLQRLVSRSQDNDLGGFVVLKGRAGTSGLQRNLNLVVSFVSEENLVDGHLRAGGLVVAQVLFLLSRGLEDVLEGTELSNGFEGDVVLTDRAGSGSRSTLVLFNLLFPLLRGRDIVGSGVGGQTHRVVGRGGHRGHGVVVGSVSIRVSGGHGNGVPD